MPAPTTAVSSRSMAVTRSSSSICPSCPSISCRARSGPRKRPAVLRIDAAATASRCNGREGRIARDTSATVIRLTARLTLMLMAIWPGCMRSENSASQCRPSEFAVGSGAGITIGNNTSHSHTSEPSTMPAMIAGDGVRGRYTASSTAGANCDRAVNDISPKSLSASVPLIARLYSHDIRNTARIPARRNASTRGRRSAPASPPPFTPPSRCEPKPWLPSMIDKVNPDRIIMPVAALRLPR